MSSSSITVLKLMGPPLDEAARILTDAFFDDPLMVYLFPQRRKQQLQAYFGFFLNFALEAGEIYVTDPLVGVAAWLLRLEKISEEKVGAMMEQARGLFDEQSFERVIAFTQALLPVYQTITSSDYRYLLFLGVNYAERGKGIGSMLMHPGLELADASGLSCILDTNKERNLSLYKKHGFKVCHEGNILADAPYTWTMIRPPSEQPLG